MNKKSPKPKVFFLPHADTKSENWIKHANPKTNSHFLQLKTNPAIHCFQVIFISVRLRAAPIYFFRYLNDYPSLLLTIFRTAADALTIAACKLLGGTTNWIAHNVDRETDTYHPSLSIIRRHLISSFSKSIYFTDPLLIKDGIKKLDIPPQKATWTCFGPPTLRDAPLDAGNHQIANTILDARQQHKNVLVGLCATALKSKCYHLRRMIDLLDISNSSEGIELIFVLVCDSNGSRYDNEVGPLIEKLKKRADVLFFPNGVNVNEQHLKNYVDFAYRSLDDLSVPLTIYHSADAGIPILTHSVGHCGKMVQEYKIGLVIDDTNNFDIKNLRNFIDNWAPLNSTHFLKKLNWEIGANQLFR